MTPTGHTRQATGKQQYTERAGDYQTSSPADKYGNPAGLSSQRDNARLGSSYGSPYEGINHPKAAGKNTVINGHAVITSWVDNVEHVIKTEKPTPKIQDNQTTYNRTHAKDGFPVHYPPSPKREPEVKIDSAYGGLTHGKRYPYEVKSIIILP